MANRRMINGSIWEDEFFTALSIFHRLLWVGIITQCADDQGRLRDSAALIRSNVFPLDDIKLEDIEVGITEFYKAGKIERYKAGNKELVQIINWWKHQSPQWAGKSNFQAPDRWVDRERYQSKGGIINKLNWDKLGGYEDTYIDTFEDTLPGIKVNDKVNDNEKDNEKDNDNEAARFSSIQKYIEQLTGYPPNGSKAVKAINEILEMKALDEDIKKGFDWLVDNGVVVRYYNQLVNPIRTSMSIRKQKSNKPFGLDGMKFDNVEQP